MDSMLFVTPAGRILIVPLLVIGPPVRPGPVAMLMTVPLPPPLVPLPLPKVCPGAKVIRPLLAMERPVSVGELPFDPNSRFNLPDGVAVSLPVGSACQRKSCVTANELVLLKDDDCKSNGLEMNPCVAVAVPIPGNNAPPAETVLVKAAVVPVNPPVSPPPLSFK